MKCKQTNVKQYYPVVVSGRVSKGVKRVGDYIRDGYTDVTCMWHSETDDNLTRQSTIYRTKPETVTIPIVAIYHPETQTLFKQIKGCWQYHSIDPFIRDLPKDSQLQ